MTALLHALCAAARGEIPGDSLVGCRCMNCGYADVTPTEIETCVARHAINARLHAALAAEDVAGLMRLATDADAPGAAELRLHLREAVLRRGLELIERVGPLHRCPSCEDVQTVRFRWTLSPDGRLEAGRGGAPLRAAG